MSTSGAGRPRRARYFVISAIVGAVLFGAYLAYLAYAVDSFPAEQRPFSDYASVSSTEFNGTVFSFKLDWLTSEYLPLYAQLTSRVSDAANTPVCETQLTSVSAGQTVYMPFRITPTSAVLNSVELSIAVRPLAGGSDFTIVYEVPSASAQQGDVTPKSLVCEQPTGFE